AWPPDPATAPTEGLQKGGRPSVGRVARSGDRATTLRGTVGRPCHNIAWHGRETMPQHCVARSGDRATTDQRHNGDKINMAKQLLYTDEARKKLLAGAEKLSRAVGSTLGPTGRNVIIDKSFGGPTVTKDGVTVSKEIELPDPFENMGAKLVNAVAQKTSDVAGDGTTTATILALSIYQEGLRNITAGANPMSVKRGIDKAVEAVVKHLEGMSKRLSKKEEMEQVATISANNDPTIGKLMADAFEKVGKDGVITVEEGKTSDTTLEFVEGMQFDKGYISPYFITNPTEMRAELEDAHILIHEKKLANVRDMLPLLEKIAQAAKPLLIIAEDVE